MQKASRKSSETTDYRKELVMDDIEVCIARQREKDAELRRRLRAGFREQYSKGGDMFEDS